MAYGLKYYKEFAWTNYANDTTGNTRIEILENNYSGSSVEIEELSETPVQLRLDNTGDMINQTIKKTSLILSIIDTNQFDYSQFYTSDGKKYKVNLISSVANWAGYLVPQSFGQELGTNGLISITASDGLHLLQGIDYVADKNRTLKLADFIADIEAKIGLSTFDRSISLATDKGDLWQQFIYEGMFLDKNYEDCLDMVLTAYGLQVRYWKLFPVTSILSHSFSGTVKCLDNVPMVDYLPIAKKLKINQNLTTLPDILEDAMVDDATDVIERTPSYWKLAKWDTVSDNGLPVYPYKDRQSSDNMYKTISMYAIPTNAPYDTQRITGHEGSKYVLREFDSTPFQIEFNANFGRLSVYGRSSETGYQEKLRPISWSQLHWGLYDTKTNKSFSKATNSWSITGRPTYSTANTIRVDNPADSDVTVYINIPKTTGDVLGLELFLFTPSFAYNNPAAEATNGIFSINSIKIAEVGGVSENELYSEIKGTITVGDNIDIIEYDYELGTSPSYPTNTSLYYGSSLYNNIYDQITSFTLAGNSVNQMQYLANTILYSNGAGRKSVFSGTFAPMNNGNLMFYKASVNNVNCLINSFTLDVRRVKFVDAEFVEIVPFTFTNYTITSESSIGSSDWGGSGGSSGTVGGGGSTVDTSNFVVKTGAVTQNIEGNVTVEGSVVAGATNGVSPDDLPVATSSLFGVVKFDPTTLALNGSNQLTVIGGGGGSDVAWGTPTSQYSPLTINSVTRNLSVDGHTHSYLPLSGGTLNGNLHLTQPSQIILANGQSIRDNGGAGLIIDGVNTIYLHATTVLANGNTVWHAGNFNPSNYLPLSGGTLTGSTVMITGEIECGFRFRAEGNTGDFVGRYSTYMSLYNDFNPSAEFKIPDSGYPTIGGNTVWHAGNFNPANYLSLSGGTLTGQFNLSRVGLSTDNFINFVNDTQTTRIGIRNPYSAYGLTFVDPNNNYYKIWHEGNDGAGSGLDADLLDGKHNGEITAAYFAPKMLSSANTLDNISDGVWFYSNGYNPTNSVGDNSALLQIGSRWWDIFQLAFPGNNSNSLHFRSSKYESESSRNWNSWKTIAFTDSNVASATKLQNTRTIWGQNFNGEGNVDGVFRSLVDPSVSGTPVFKILRYPFSPYGLVMRGYDSGEFSLQSQRETTSSEYFSLSINPLGGNVGIGTTSPSFKLDVNGTLRATGTITAQNGIITDYEGSYWLSMATRVNQIRGDINATTNSAHSLYCVKNSNGDAIAFGGLGVNTGFYGFTATRIANGTNGTDWSTTWDVSTGQLNHSGNLYAGGYISASNRIFTGYDAGIANSFSCSNWFRSNGATGWYNETYVAGIHSDAANVVRTYSTNKFKVYNTAIDSILTLGGVTAANVVSSGAVVAGALNGTLPDDLPVATSSLFGVVKTGTSINNNAGLVNINGRHYTTTSTYTDASVREITAELALGTGSMANGTLDQIQLSFAPLTTTRGLTANVIATDTGVGIGLKLSFRKDTRAGRWYIMIYNDSGAAVTRDGILLSIRGQQTI